MELISVIVPVYNVELYLEECVESILGQSYQNIEVILVNDGSTDKSGKYVKSLSMTKGLLYCIRRTVVCPQQETME